ncbi:IS66 family insertion sequence element accessory protein TnpA [Paenibacillus koleovorans]|uniref:IS66 family insertion sequence element accessory protein TnpA n=1 Tax=Paenibacillus koleovorans TaxID=121608 RepID=UPI000FD77AFB|nr:hypothetical protein [Paenibacillus koleovorans]
MNGSDQTEKWQLWQERISEYRASGLTMRAWCAARQLSYYQLKYWLRKQSGGKRVSTATTWVAVNPAPAHAPEASPLKHSTLNRTKPQ